MLTVYNTVIVTLFYCTFMCSLYIKFVEYAYTWDLLQLSHANLGKALHSETQLYKQVDMLHIESEIRNLIPKIYEVSLK